MKQRATVICQREGEILLVARNPSRWSLPGGSIRRAESSLEAALRELEEETGIRPPQLTYLFFFGGRSKGHHVFWVGLDTMVIPTPRNEIAQCDWFAPDEIARLITSIPTREIVRLSQYPSYGKKKIAL